MPEPTDRFSVTVDLVADMAVINPFDFFVEESAETWPFQYDALLLEELGPYLKPDPVDPLLAQYLSKVDRTAGRRTVDFLIGLNTLLQGDISYLIRMEPGVQTPQITLQNRSGSCRDSAWLLVQILRNLGMAARFVSGYLIQLKPDVKPINEGAAAGASQDFTGSSCLGRSLCAGGWLDRARCHVRPAGRRRAYSFGGDAASAKCRADLGRARAGAGHFDFKMAVTRILETRALPSPTARRCGRRLPTAAASSMSG